MPGDGPVHFVALDDGTAVPDAGRAHAASGEGFSTVVVGQKVRWVLEMMRGPEFAGARIARVEHRPSPTATVEEFTLPRRGAR